MKKAAICLVAVMVLLAAVPAAAAVVPEQLPDPSWVAVTDVADQQAQALLWDSPELKYYNGRYYLPAEEIEAILGVPIYWDRENHRVVLGERFPYNYDTLEYYLNYDYQNGEMVFTVFNPHPYSQNLNFNSGEKFDLVLTSGGFKVWQLAEEQQYAQVQIQETIQPWGVKTYRVQLPALPAGQYQAYSFFKAIGHQGLSASTSLWLSPAVSQPAALSYSLQYKAGGWKSQDQLVFRINNLTGQDVDQYYFGEQQYNVVIKNDRGVVWSLTGSSVTAGNVYHKSFPAGGSSAKFIYPELPPGRYVAEAYDYAVSRYQPVTSLNFSVK